MADQIFIQVRFKEQTEAGEYNDALYFTQAEYATKTANDISALKTTRVNNFVTAVKNPPILPPPTVDELNKVLKSLEDQVLEIKDQIAKVGK